MSAALSVGLKGDAAWGKIPVKGSLTYTWDDRSTYVQNPPYFEGMQKTPAPIVDIKGARELAIFGDSITTDHISPAGSIKKDSPAGAYLLDHGVQPKDFNQYGTRRGNHEVMMRGTFANIRIKNHMMKDAAGVVPEGGLTKFYPGGETLSIYDAAMRYAQQKTPLVVFAGAEYGNGSSRDWAAKGTRLLGVRAVIATTLVLISVFAPLMFLLVYRSWGFNAAFVLTALTAVPSALMPMMIRAL